MKFNNHKQANCEYYYYNESDLFDLYLKSYSTNVAFVKIGDKSVLIYCTGTYSATTRKHIGYFAKLINDLYGTHLSYYDFKNAVGKTGYTVAR